MTLHADEASEDTELTIVANMQLKQLLTTHLVVEDVSSCTMPALPLLAAISVSFHDSGSLRDYLSEGIFFFCRTPSPEVCVFSLSSVHVSANIV